MRSAGDSKRLVSFVDSLRSEVRGLPGTVPTGGRLWCSVGCLLCLPCVAEGEAGSPFFVDPGPPLWEALSKMLENSVVLVDKARDKAHDKDYWNGAAPHRQDFSAESIPCESPFFLENCVHFAQYSCMKVARDSLLHSVLAALERSRAVGLAGPRQCGKSTLAREIAGLRCPSTYFD